MKVTYLVKLAIFALLLVPLNFVAAYLTGIRCERIAMMIISFFGIYVLFEFLFKIIQRHKNARYLIKYFMLSGLRIFTILITAYLFLNPKNIENRNEALFFLFNYLAFLIYDITLKVKFINKNTN